MTSLERAQQVRERLFRACPVAGALLAGQVEYLDQLLARAFDRAIAEELARLDSVCAQADVYHQVHTGTIARTEELVEGTLFADFDAGGNLLGVEILAQPKEKETSV